MLQFSLLQSSLPFSSLFTYMSAATIFIKTPGKHVRCPLRFRPPWRNQYQFGSSPHVFNLINCIKPKPIIKQ